MRCGGGTNHRQRLDDGILIKDNHKRLAGGIARRPAGAAARTGCRSKSKSKRSSELDQAIAAGVPRILLDNFTTYDIREAVRACADARWSRSRAG